MTDKMNPLDAYQESKEAAKTQRKQHEIDVWQHWKNNGEQPKHLEPLLKLYEPIFAQKIRQWKPKFVPESAFKADLIGHAIKAFKSYDPDRGAALNTHVEGGLRKAMRYGNRGANLSYIPEGQANKIGLLNKTKDELKEELSREPTYAELSAHIRGLSSKYKDMTPKRVETIMKAVRRDIPMGRSAGEDSFDYSSGSEAGGHGFEEQQIAVASQILDDIWPGKPDMHAVFNFTFATNDHPKVSSTGELAKRLKKSDAQVSRLKTQMGATLRRYMGLEEED
jgi:DNA-directed RNA polymerase specialized sigma subunit